MITLDWVPNLSLGPFNVGGSFEDATNLVSFQKSDSEHDEMLRMTSYMAFDGALRLEVRDGAIESISSEKEFLFRGGNMIGMKLAEVEGLLEEKADEVDPPDFSDDPAIVDFTNKGLQLVFNDGRVTSATCY